MTILKRNLKERIWGKESSEEGQLLKGNIRKTQILKRKHLKKGSSQQVGHCGQQVGHCGQQVGHCGQQVGHYGEQVGHCGQNVGHCGQQVGHCGQHGPQQDLGGPGGGRAILVFTWLCSVAN